MSYLDLFPSIRAFVFDVDGVLTNGHVILLPDGQQMRHMHSKDGYALQLAVKHGYIVAAITGGKNVQVKERLEGFGVQDVYLLSSQKDHDLTDLMKKHGLQPEEVMYMGDDIPDLAALHRVALPCCPKDAAPEVKAMSAFVSEKNGGEGCVRDIIEKVMRSHSKWYDASKLGKEMEEFTW